MSKQDGSGFIVTHRRCLSSLILGLMLVFAQLNTFAQATKTGKDLKGSLLWPLVSKDADISLLTKYRSTYKNQMAEIAEKYPLIAERIAMSDLLIASMLYDYAANKQGMNAEISFSDTTVRIACQLNVFAYSTISGLICQPNLGRIVARQCSSPSSYLRVRLRPDGTYDVGCDSECAIGSWVSCIQGH